MQKPLYFLWTLIVLPPKRFADMASSLLKRERVKS
jgi:hypothetical protein